MNFKVTDAIELLQPEMQEIALANLIYVQDMVRERKAKNPDFDPESIDIVAEIPKQCMADKLIRAVYSASIKDNSEEIQHESVVLGYVKPGGRLVLFSGNQKKINVSLEPKDKLIIFSDH